MNKRLFVLVLCVLSVLFSMLACDRTDDNGCTFENGAWKCPNYEAMQEQFNDDSNYTMEDFQRQLEELNQDVSNAAQNASWGDIPETLDNIPSWDDKEKAETYQDTRNVATNNGADCGYHDGQKWVYKPCQ